MSKDIPANGLLSLKLIIRQLGRGERARGVGLSFKKFLPVRNYI